MNIQHLNRNMREKHAAELRQTSERLPQRLQAVLDGGIATFGQCVCLASLLTKAHAAVSEFPDETGYECFVNLVHVEDFTNQRLVAVAMSFFAKLSGLLANSYPERRFQGIISASDNSCSMRFHTNRVTERWLSEDLDSYDEAICLIKLGNVDRD